MGNVIIKNAQSHLAVVDINQSSDFPDAQVTVFPYINCDKNRDNRGEATPLTLKPNECKTIGGMLGSQKPPSSAVVKAKIPKGVRCTLKMYKEHDCRPDTSDPSGPPSICVTNSEDPVFGDPEADRSGGLLSAIWECKDLPVLTEFPPADITVYVEPKCNLAGEGNKPVEREYPAVQPNVCLQPDKGLINNANSARATMVLDSGIPIPDGYKCELVLFQGTDCRKTSEPSYARGPSGQCLTPAGQHMYPIKGIMWQCGFA